MSDSHPSDTPADSEPPHAADQGDGHDDDDLGPADHDLGDHGPADHDLGDHGPADRDPADHGPAEGTLGSVDSAAWGAGILGVALGLVVALCFVLATGPA
jgi:hypothetical protein